MKACLPARLLASFPASLPTGQTAGLPARKKECQQAVLVDCCQERRHACWPVSLPECGADSTLASQLVSSLQFLLASNRKLRYGQVR